MAETRILFVCLGNICRSPLAEGIFRELVARRGVEKEFKIDSCGTSSYHIGQAPHPDSRSIAKKNGISLQGQRARALCDKDYESFDILVAMDRENLSDIAANPAARAVRAFCLREYDPESDDLDVPDPYYVGGFQNVFDIIQRSCERLLDDLLESK